MKRRKILSLIAMGAVHDAFGQAVGASASFEHDVADLSELKSKARQWADQLKQKFKPDSDKLKRGLKLYVDARAAIDRWISSMRLALINGRSPEESLSPSIRKEATEAAQAFFKYAQDALLHPRGKLEVLIGLGTTLADAASHAWDAYQHSEELRKKQLLDELEGLRWSEF